MLGAMDFMASQLQENESHASPSKIQAEFKLSNFPCRSIFACWKDRFRLTKSTLA